VHSRIVRIDRRRHTLLPSLLVLLRSSLISPSILIATRVVANNGGDAGASLSAKPVRAVGWGEGPLNAVIRTPNGLAALFGRLTDPTDRETYASLISFVDSLPPGDELSRLVELLGLLSLLGQWPRLNSVPAI
jgi:hypothetical protein